MNDLERELRSIAAIEPSGDFDRRMNRLFLESERRRAWISKPIPLWQGLVACALAVTLGYLYRGNETPEPAVAPEMTRTVYIVPASPEFQRAIQGSVQHRSLADESGSYVIEVSPFTVDSFTGTGDAT